MKKPVRNQNFECDREILPLLKLLSQGVTETEKGEGIDQETFFDQLEKRLERLSRAD